ncbi:probable tyrosine-protein phosphatase at1g05000 [Phtheirospermum japonicum]|uniref:diphosphoinositol-polyphosphate diphosphatase n=1 Tax=Phtheirospermum japonicum TaxID=374723 RepID=A0A830B2D2_9LAMI|nr:probable tyrosine-protein phosphatase at1g05000 [Phtheirospermum japonicum]
MAFREKAKGKKLHQPEGKNSTKPAALLPPINFSVVVDKFVYRSGHLEPCNFPFLQSLELRSIIYLCPERYAKENLQFLQSNKINLFQLGIDCDNVSEFLQCRGYQIVFVICDEKNYPVLIHCKCGLHRTGCLVGCLRKLHNWCTTPVLEEYKKIAGNRFREVDLKFLREYDVSCLRRCSTAAAVPGSRCPCCPGLLDGDSTVL